MLRKIQMCEFSKMLFRSSIVGACGFFCRSVISKMHSLFIQMNSSSVVEARMMQANSFEPSLGIASNSSIHIALCSSDEAQITSAVVKSISVDVIDPQSRITSDNKSVHGWAVLLRRIGIGLSVCAHSCNPFRLRKKRIISSINNGCETSSQGNMFDRLIERLDNSVSLHVAFHRNPHSFATIRRAFILTFFLVAIPAAHALQSYTAWCEVGNTKANISGSTSTNTLQASYPKCIVTVYIVGTTSKATLFSDNIPTPLANPFTAAQNGSFTFYAADGNYDVVTSGGLNGGFPLSITTPNIHLGGGGSGGSGCQVSGTAGFLLLNSGLGTCIDANTVTIGIQGSDTSAAGIALTEAGTGGVQITNSYAAGGGVGIVLHDANPGITLREDGAGGITLRAGNGGFSINGGSDGFPGIINGNALNLAASGTTAIIDDMHISSQTNHIQLKSGTTANTGYSSLDTTPLLSGDIFNIAIPRFSGTWALYTGSLTANDCVQVNATANGFIDAGGACGVAGGGSAFSAITSGSNTTATMVIGTGASLAPAGTGSIAATAIDGVVVTGTPSAGQVPTATSPSAATWQTPASGNAFSAITNGTNTTAAMLVGTGASLASIGAGTIAATTTVALASTPTVCASGQYASGVDTGGNAICVALPTQPASQYIAPQAIAGCGIEYVSGLTYNVGACTYAINGNIYHSPLTSITLSAADPTNPRIDVIFVDTTQIVQQLTGVPAGTPQQPVVDPSAQLELTFVLVPNAATTPANTTLVDIYLEGVEWTGAKGGTNGARVNLTSTSNPFSGTHDTEFGTTGTVAPTTFAGYTVPAAGTVNLSNYNTLTFYIRNKAAWLATNSVTIQWFSGGTLKGSGIVLSNGAFGYNATTNTTTYQQISIPTATFGIAGIPVTSVRFTVSGTGAALTGFYLDQITLQGGNGGIVLPTTLMNFKGAWSSTATYNPNDTVTSGGTGYVALTQNTNVAVTTTTTWAQLGGAGSGSITSFAAPTGSWPIWLTPIVTNPAGPTVSLSVSASAIPYSVLTALSANSILGALSATTPSGLPVPSCSGASNALIWTSGVGFGCNSITGGGGGNTTSTALTNNFLPKANGVNSVIDSKLSDDGTTLSYAGSGTVHAFVIPEGTTTSGVAASDVLYTLSSTHRWMQNPNNIGALIIPGIATAGIANNCLKLAANGIDLIDTGSPCGSGSGNVSAGGTLTLNAVVIGGGTTAISTISTDSTTTHALFATAGAPAFRALAATDIPASLTSTTSVNSTTIPASSTLPVTIASGTSALGTSAISSATCATVVTTTATGAVTTDTIIWNPNGSIKAVTGYIPAIAGGLTIAGYPTVNAVNWDVCNWTSSSITPGAVTLNWKVVR